MAQPNDTSKEWVLYWHRYGHTLPLGCYKTVEEAKTHEWLNDVDVVWKQTHETGYIGYMEMLPMYPRFGMWTPYCTINQDGRAIFDLLNPLNPARFKKRGSWIDRLMNLRKEFGG